MLKLKTKFSFVLILLFAVGIIAVEGQTPVKQIYAIAPDGVKIAIQEYGNPDGAEIVLIHGLLGSHLDWLKQTENPSLLSKYRLITYDLRGHGLSGKPSDAASYKDGKLWGDDLQTVIAAAKLKRPTLVGWSLGGVVITNYLETYGDANIAGAIYVDGVIELKPEFLVSHPATTQAVSSDDLGIYLEGVRQFLKQCFYTPPDAATFNLLYANAAAASPVMTKAVNTGISIPADTALPKVSVPVLLIYGENDDLVNRRMVERGQKLMPRAEVSFYPKTGHAPFLEKSERFNKELEKFVSSVSKQPKD
jgi:non-heme chloroperoxidase